MRVATAYTADRFGHLPNCFFKATWQVGWLSRTVVEDGCHLPSECLVLVFPEIDRKDSVSASEEEPRCNLRSRAPRTENQSVKREREIIRSQHSNHLDAHEALGDVDGVATIDGNRVDRL